MTAASGFNETPEATRQATAQPLHRSRANRVFAGVCGGIAERYGADASAVRLLTVILALFTAIFPLLILYLVAAIVIPERIGGEAPGGQVAAAPLAPGRATLLFGVVLVVVGIAALANELFRVDWDLLWPVALIALGGALAVTAWRR